MKKLIIGVLSFMVILGASNVAMAHGNSGNGTVNFGQALKYMQEMHPDWSQKDIKEMYNEHHGTQGAEPSHNFEQMNENMGKMSVK